MVSMMHLETGNDSVVRKLKDKDGHSVCKQVSIPPPVLEYNQRMDGMDLSDQSISYYNVHQWTKKYWRILFLHFIDVMLINAHILYCMHLPPDEQTKINSREILVTKLCQEKDNPQIQLVSQQQMDKVRAPHQLNFVDREEQGYCDLTRLLKYARHQTRYKYAKCNMLFCLESNRNCFKKWHSYLCDHLRIS